MTSEQINLIQQNFDRIMPQADAAATVFYNRLFSMKPALRLLFPDDLAEQKKKLMTTLGVAIKSLHETEKLIPILENLGRRHALYGVRDEHYRTVGTALLLTLRDALGKDFTSEAHAAWAEMYRVVAAVMKRGARHLEQENEETDFNLQETKRMKIENIHLPSTHYYHQF
jgi:hemoglobin-like flavoprotein